MKRDKWFLNSPTKWNMLKGLKNIYDWYLILTFPRAIFLKVHAHYRHELVFFWRFSRPRGGAHYTTLNTVYLLTDEKTEIAKVVLNTITLPPLFVLLVHVLHLCPISLNKDTQILKHIFSEFSGRGKKYLCFG